MKIFFTKYFLLVLLLLIGNESFSQNSMLVNFGSSTCTNPTDASFSIIQNPLSGTPTLLANCDFSAEIPNFYGVYIAYNPTDNNLYISSIQSGTNSTVWTLNIGLPDTVGCPAVIPAPNVYPYILNNFEFDSNGNLWAFSNYNAGTGTCLLSNFNLVTGSTLSSKTVQFPVGFYPTDILNGDLTILPNGRLFCTLGASPISQLYEITNYSGGFGNATATYLATMPLNCYAIAFLNGELEVSGSNYSTSCYYFPYNIASNTLGAVQSFPNGLSPVDNTSIDPIVGATKQLVSSTVVNANTANLTYIIYLKNMGNTIINNINVIDDLSAAFGAGNVSNVTAAFTSNPAGLVLNGAYNGTTVTSLLAPGQQLHNRILGNTNYFSKIQITCQVTNLVPGVTYYNSAIGNGTIGSGPSLASISDSSNNGAPTDAVIDPNNNNYPGDPGENVPTPYTFPIILTVNFISADATLINNTTSMIHWSVATPVTSANEFEVEYSTDGKNWNTVGTVAITSNTQSDYNIEQQDVPTGNIYYRIKEIDNDGSYVYSRVIILDNNNGQTKYVVFPNPASNMIQVIAPYGVTGNCSIELFDATGRKLIETIMNTSSIEINITDLPNGSYILRIDHDDNITTQKVLIIH
ncbi:MAG TPA: T9SS type A sorting domain-containing protein [Ferruginibacter sp.]|nr:T9SS type A sorting domain-containing protein [Ferruginibacter sp.]